MKKSLPSFLLLLTLILFVWGYLLQPKNNSEFDYNALKTVPVQHQGRVKPLDTVARNSLLQLRENQTLYDKDKAVEPIEWLATLCMDASRSAHFEVFRIDHPDIQTLIEQRPHERKQFSYNDVEPYLETIRQQAIHANGIESSARDSYQMGVINLWEKLILYSGLSHTLFVAASDDPIEEVHAFQEGVRLILPLLQDESQRDKIDEHDQNLLQWFWQRYEFMAGAAQFSPLYPRLANKAWQSMGEAILDISEKRNHPGMDHILQMIDAFRKKDSATFNSNLYQHLGIIKAQAKENTRRVALENLFNDFQPFFLSILLYISSFATFMLSWLFLPKKLRQLSYYLLLVAFLIHTIGLVSRMLIEERPPVTNLYSSAIFVGWGAVALSVVIERLFKNGIASCISSVIGSLTLIIAHHLASDGDTMEAMRAVLNSNFWLSTHVVTITFGYSSAFLAGFIACGYVIRGFFSPTLDKETKCSFFHIVYGIICFSTLFSFVGTVLGGIWADQSWGRFWGWDPKENGALMLVLWNAIILHSHWGNLVRKERIMLLAIFGNILTSFSWFGVNMLGVGLHSYGFMDGSLFWLFSFMASQMVLIAIGFIQTVSPTQDRPNNN